MNVSNSDYATIYAKHPYGSLGKKWNGGF
jgi:hypothetical protein